MKCGCPSIPQFVENELSRRDRERHPEHYDIEHTADGFVATPKRESDPHGKQPGEAGAKFDVGKAPIRRGLLEYFPRACLAVAEVSAFGAKKYTWGGWQTVPEGVERYGDAELRHVVKAAIDGENDPESGLLHAAHEAWNALAVLELLLREKEKAPVKAELYCPRCKVRHFDIGEWLKRPHKTHQCQSCGNEWRPFEHPTVGV